MPERDDDPIASTQLFRAFVRSGETEPTRRLRSRAVTLTVILAVAVALVAAAVAGWLVMR